MSAIFNFEDALKELQAGKELSGKDGVLRPLTEAAITAELNASRDRAGTFEPQLIKKNQTQLTPEIDRKVLSLFSHGIYGIELSTGTMGCPVWPPILPIFTA